VFTPVRGTPDQLDAVTAAAATVDVVLPGHVDKGIGTWFNRAVVSSQAFSKMLDTMELDVATQPGQEDGFKLRAWLANGMEKSFGHFFSGAKEVAGAIYHLTDAVWVVPALKHHSEFGNEVGLLYDEGSSARQVMRKENKPNPNGSAIAGLPQVIFSKRTKTKIMHNKFLVSGERLFVNQSRPQRLLCGSANFTTGGLTTQANLVHTFDSPELSEQYLERYHLLTEDLTTGKTAKEAKWLDPVTVGDAGITVFFSPEPEGDRTSLNRVVEAIHRAQSSVLFCLFTPTDEILRRACFAVGDNGKMMFGLVNLIAESGGEHDESDDLNSVQLAQMELYHRKYSDKPDVIDGRYFSPAHTPVGFLPEIRLFPGEKPPPFPPVIIHHKFIVIDAETDSPVIYSGSANMSNASQYGNDENLLEIRGSRRLAGVYLAEFMRLYEHYRARALFIRRQEENSMRSFKLDTDSGWAKKYYRPGTPEERSKRRMAREP
jgi:phosphatidylserine/phosphatidylglycerophosphate/cardiolipin synthase-like enzyme